MAVNVCFCVKLSPNKKSIFGSRMKSQILYFVLFASFLAVVSAADMDKTCASVQSIFEKKGMLSAVDIQALPNSDAGELCSNRGCCGPNARSRLSQQARGQLEGALRSELTKLADILANRAKRFDEFFRKLLKLSREGFHTMFKRTYGIIYEQHSYVFEQFFEQLERYYARGDTNFDAMMDSFFSILYQKMFIVLNSQYNFDDKYLKCVSEHMRDIQPFEDVPSKLSVQLRRAFVATRTFHKALRSGADVVNNMKQVGVSQECVTAWARLRYCGACAGERPPACSRYCHNVVRGCLPTHADLSEQWDAYVDAVEKVADRLLGPFNIAMVVEPIDIKISEAIMSFQERNQEISQKIFSGCGKPDLGGAGGAGPFFAPDRARRSARAIPDFDWYHRGNDVDDFEIEASFESLYNNDASLLSLRTPEGIRRATEELAEQAKSRDRFLQYMRGKISLDDFEEHERRKRAAEPEPAPGGGELDYRAYEFDGKRGSKKKKPAAGRGEEGHGAESGPALERLVRETRARVRSSRRYWSLLPAVLCSPASVTTAPCFNGTHVASYTAIAAGEGTAALASNPEVRGAGGGVAGGAGGRAQLDALRALTARLKDAYNGVEVQWKDASDAVAKLIDSSQSIQLRTSCSRRRRRTSRTRWARARAPATATRTTRRPARRTRPTGSRRTTTRTGTTLKVRATDPSTSRRRTRSAGRRPSRRSCPPFWRGRRPTTCRRGVACSPSSRSRRPRPTPRASTPACGGRSPSSRRASPPPARRSAPPCRARSSRTRCPSCAPGSAPSSPTSSSDSDPVSMYRCNRGDVPRVGAIVLNAQFCF